MRILLVYCNAMLENALPIGISQISACLKQNNHRVELFDTTFYHYDEKSDTEVRIDALQFAPCPIVYNNCDMEEDFIAKIKSYRPALIGFSLVEPTYHLAHKLVDIVRSIDEFKDIKVCLGGVHAILAPETLVSWNADYICIGEGENSFPELCKKIENGKSVTDQLGFYIREDEIWHKNKKYSMTNISSVPLLDFSIFDSSYLNKPMMGNVYKTISIETTRGCPYKCTYCGDNSLRLLYKEEGSWFRQKSLEQIDEELHEYIKCYDPEFVYIISDAFMAGSVTKIKNFVDMYRKYSIPFWFNTRPEDISDEKIKLVKDVGCMRVSIGLEHGNEEFRRQHLRRNYSNKKFLDACSILRGNNLSFSTNIIIGLPFETRELVFDSIKILREGKPDSVSTHIYSPYHGSEMRDVAIREGMIASDLIAGDFFQTGYLLNNPTMSEKELLGLFKTIPLYVELPEDRWGEIVIAENDTDEGILAFESLRKEFSTLKGWKDL